jgi:tryptophan synthase alpha chain
VGRSLADALVRPARDGPGLLVPYLLVDAARQRQLARIVAALRQAGCAAVELGFPFSDPVADGPVLQAAHARALAHGTHWSHLVDAVRLTSRELPCAVMTYANPVYTRGVDEALRELVANGASGLIVPDLPVDESVPWRRAAGRAGLALVELASPATSEARLDRIVRTTGGFLYLVSRFGTTGAATERKPEPLRPLIDLAHARRPDLPVLIGFGVRTARDVRRARSIGADGVVVGTAFEERWQGDPRGARVGRWLASLRAAA